jgi:predicted PurR-regulated permease PerM
MIMESFISWLQKWLNRGLSIFVSYIVFLLILLGLLVIVIPFLYKQMSEAWSIGLSYLSEVQTKVSENGVYSTIVNSEKLPDSLKEYFVNISADQ